MRTTAPGSPEAADAARAAPRSGPPWTGWVGLGCVGLALVAVVCWSGNLGTGPRLTDDNQIFLLTEQLAREGFWPTYRQQLVTRAGQGRYLPVFLLEKVAKARLYGNHLVAWRLHLLALGLVTAWGLFAFARRLGFTEAESVLFSGLTVLGTHSLTWVRLIHGEALGLAFFALALAALGFRTEEKRRPHLLDAAFVVAVTLACLSKESFLLTIPALIVLRQGLLRTAREAQGALRPARGSGVMLVLVALVGLAAVVYLTFGLDFDRWYVGWERIERDALARTIGDFFAALSGELLLLLAAGVGLVYFLDRRESGASGASLRRLAFFTAVAVLLTVPQIILYMKLGFSIERRPLLTLPRYLVPAVVGWALLAVSLLRAMRERKTRLRHGQEVSVHPRWVSWVSLVATLVVAIYLVLQGITAWRSAEAFAERTESESGILALVAARTGRDDPILLVYDIDRLRTPKRLEIVLRHYHRRDHLLRYPLSSERSRHAEAAARLRAATLRRLGTEPGEAVGAVVSQSKGGVFRGFRRRTKWIDVDDFESVDNGTGTIVLVRPTGPSGVGRER